MHGALAKNKGKLKIEQLFVIANKSSIFALLKIKFKKKRGLIVPSFCNKKMITKQLVADLANERIQDRNPALYIVEITINSGNQILVELDHETEGVSIEDCMSVSRNIEHNLDREVQDFSLEVASAGLSKPFRVLKQYIKNIGKQVKVKTLENGKFEGVLMAASEDDIIVTTKEKVRVEGRKKKEWIETNHTIKMETIKETNLIITFK